MNLQQMIDAINRRVDDVVSTIDAVEWLNSAKNQMAIAANAIFPDLTGTDLTESFVFDERFHEAPVLFAAARFKEQDSSQSEAAGFMAQFEAMKREFVARYVVPDEYKANPTTEAESYETYLQPSYSWQGEW